LSGDLILRNSYVTSTGPIQFNFWHLSTIATSYRYITFHLFFLNGKNISHVRKTKTSFQLLHTLVICMKRSETYLCVMYDILIDLNLS
jgi:hypothetical protein